MITFNTNGNTSYSVEHVAMMIEEYIHRLKESPIKIRLKQGRFGAELYPEDTKKFEIAASYAIPAAEGGFKLKKDGNNTTDN